MNNPLQQSQNNLVSSPGVMPGLAAMFQNQPAPMQSPALPGTLPNLPGSNFNLVGQPSIMDQLGQGLGLAGGAVSLASLLNNWGQFKKNSKLNREIAQTGLAQSKEEFNRWTTDRDSSRSNIAAAGSRSLAKQQV